MWTEKYRPRKLDEIVGGKTAIEAIRKFDWKKPLLLHGGHGVGKTTLVYALAGERNFDVVELDESNIDQASSIAETSSLYGTRRLILIDEVDKFPDIKKVSSFLEAARNPTVLTTTDPKSKRLTTIKKMCFDVQLRRPLAATIANHLMEVCRKEKINVEKEVLLEVANNSGGDIRIALTDLETIAKNRSSITKKDLEVLYSRDVEGDIYNTLSVIFKGKDLKEVVSSTWSLDEQPGNTIFWIEENTPEWIQQPKALSKAFYYLSRADIFLGRIYRRQHWGFLRYANALMTAGVNVSKEKLKYSMYKFPSYFAKLGRNKGERNITAGISEKMKNKIHASKKTIIKEDLPLMKLLLKKRRINEEILQNEYTLSKEELAYLSGN